MAHQAEHGLFVSSGLLFWSRALDSPPFRARVMLDPLSPLVFAALWAAKEWLSPSVATAGPGVIHD